MIKRGLFTTLNDSEKVSGGENLTCHRNLGKSKI